MKKLLIAFCLPIILFCVQIPPAASQETCEGVTSFTADKGEQWVLCWTKNPEPDVVEYRIYKDGVQFSTFQHADCGESICETGPLSVSEEGTYSLTVRATDGKNESGDSNTITLTVEDRPPSAPSGCSIRRFF